MPYYFYGFWTFSISSIILIWSMDKKSLKGQSKVVNRRKTDNTMTKKANSNLENTTQKTKDRATRRSLKTEDELSCTGSISRSCSTSDNRRVIVKLHEHHLTWKLCWTTIPIQTNRTSFVHGNSSGHQNTELKAWRRDLSTFNNTNPTKIRTKRGWNECC